MTEAVPSIGISYNVELPGKRTIVLQSFVGRDDEIKVLNEILDKLRISAERQFAYGMIDILKMQLEQETKIASDHAARMAQVDENMKRDWDRGSKRGDLRLSAKQEQDQRQAYAHAEEAKKRIAKVKADIAEYESKIGA